MLHKDYVKLANQGERPDNLDDLWQKRTGKYPYYYATEIAKGKKDWKKSRTAAVVSGTILLITSFLSFMSYVDTTMTREYLGYVAFVELVASAFCVAFIFAESSRGETRYTDAEWDFPDHFGQFLVWSGMTPIGVKMRSIGELRRISKDILVDTAKKDVTEERWNIDHSKEMRNSGYKELFKHQHRILTELSLVEGGYQSFYDEAGRQLAEEKPVALHDGSI